MQYFESIIQYLLPKYCLLCDTPSDIICEKCFRAVFSELPSCHICGRINTGYKPHTKCLNEKNVFKYDFVFCCWRFDRNGERIFRILREKELQRGWEYMISKSLAKTDYFSGFQIVSEGKNSPLFKIFSEKYSNDINARKNFLIIAESVNDLYEVKSLPNKIREKYPEARIAGLALFGVDKTKLLDEVRNVNPIQA